jgi:Dual-action HEIGH metallo-peptidase
MKNLRTLSALGCVLLALAACSDIPTSAPAATDESQSELARQVAALGFRGDMVEDHGDYVLVEGDIYITKAQLAAPAPDRTTDPLSPRYQYRTTNLVGSAKVNNITVNLSGLASQPGWQAAARDAITHWSGITSSHVRLTEVTGAADITVTTTCTSYNVAASASFPSGGNPGNVIYVNTCFGYSTSHAQKVHNMVHEFGHTLGFRHSNFTQLGETAGTVGAVHIWGTPTSGNATGSVMNGGTALNSWAGFAASDLTAVRSIYPLPAPAITSVTNSGGYPLITWNVAAGATSYTVRLIDLMWVNGVYQGRSFTTLATTTGTSYLDTSHGYTGQYQCSYDLGDTYTVAYEYEVVANFPNGTSSARHYAPIAQC